MYQFNLIIVFLLILLSFSVLANDRPLLEDYVKSQKSPEFPGPQILIKAHIVNVDHDYSRAFGLSFGTSTGTLSSKDGFNMNLPGADSAGNFIIPIAELGQNILLDMTLSALEKSGHAQLISDPQLVTLNKQPAVIEAGEEVPYQQATSNGGTSTSFKKAVLRLKVTPEIITPEKILLHLNINQDQVSSLTINGVPAINTQQLQTQAIIKNHSTLVLGGIMEKIKSDQHQGVPYLQNIPWLGVLFRYHKKIDNRKQLLIFVTPVIVSN